MTASLDRTTRRRSPVDALLIVAFLLTVVDAAATHAWLTAGIAVEGNPLLRRVMEVVGTGPALAGRVALGGALLLLLRLLAPRSPLARTALVVAVPVLVLVAAWHLQGLVLLAGT